MDSPKDVCQTEDIGKVELYLTSSSGVRQTFQECLNAKRILETLMVKYEEKDIFSNPEYFDELKSRLEVDHTVVPQLFVAEKHVGNAEVIDQLNETGELRKIFYPNKEFPESPIEAEAKELEISA